MVYKLVDLEGDPKHKIVSTEPSKSTLPGKKTVYRVWLNNSEFPSLDIICGAGEKIEVGVEFKAIEKNNGMNRFKLTPTRVEEVLVEYWNQGKLTHKLDNLHEAR